MNAHKIIAVVGATGAQGGGLARSILGGNGNAFKVRAITRNPKSEKARVLAELGAEVVCADLDDVRSLKAAFRGAYGAYRVTNFWEHFSPEKEIEQARNMAAAAKDENLKHVIWSTLEDTRKWVPLNDDRMPTLMGKYKVPHFDAKGEANHLFSDMDVPTTFLLASFYWDNLIYFGMGPQRGKDGRYYITLPMEDKRLSGIASQDIGKCAHGIFKKGEQYIGNTVGIAGEHLTGQQMAASLSVALGKEVLYNAVDPEVYRKFGFPGAEDLGNMFQFKCDFQDYYCGVRDVSLARALNPDLQSFDRWLEQNMNRIPLN